MFWRNTGKGCDRSRGAPTPSHASVLSSSSDRSYYNAVFFLVVWE